MQMPARAEVFSFVLLVAHGGQVFASTALPAVVLRVPIPFLRGSSHLWGYLGRHLRMLGCRILSRLRSQGSLILENHWVGHTLWVAAIHCPCLHGGVEVLFVENIRRMPCPHVQTALVIVDMSEAIAPVVALAVYQYRCTSARRTECCILILSDEPCTLLVSSQRSSHASVVYSRGTVVHQRLETT